MGAVPPAADLVLVGDSLAAGWPAERLAETVGRRAFNYGLPGDRVQNTLWRLREAFVAHLRPRQAVVVLGTNNLGDGDPPDAILRGLAEVFAVARGLWGEPGVVVVTIPRRGDPSAREADCRRVNAALMGALAPLAWARAIEADHWLGIGAQALSHLEPDRVHINAAGYDRLGAALRKELGP